MRKLNLISIAAVLACGLAERAFPQDKPAEKPAGATQGSPVPSSGARAEFLAEIEYYEQRYMRLAEAIPAPWARSLPQAWTSKPSRRLPRTKLRSRDS